MISNFSMIPIRWLLTVDSEMAFCLCICLPRIYLFSFKTRAIQEKFIAKVVTSTVNLTGKTDMIFMIHAILVKFATEFTS